MKCVVQDYRKSINETDFTPKQISAIWEFYVTKSLTSSSSQSRKVAEYGYAQLPFDKMLEIATITKSNSLFYTADRIQQTLESSDLRILGENETPIPIDIDTPRFALFMDTIIDAGKQKPKHGFSRPRSLLTHIRNALAHGRTYLFGNGNMLLTDEYKNNITGMILIKQKTLLDWIALIDKDKNFYRI